jgi:hypothetical protein
MYGLTKVEAGVYEGLIAGHKVRVERAAKTTRRYEKTSWGAFWNVLRLDAETVREAIVTEGHTSMQRAVTAAQETLSARAPS